MGHRIGLRREDKNPFERRVALTPEAVGRLVAQGIRIEVERFDRRCFPDAAYEAAGALLVDDVRDCEIVLGIKEMPLGYFREGGAYIFFSHTIKGQPYNMPMLAELVDKGCTLIDYECVKDESGRRLIFFSRHAGVTGMLDSLWTLGQRMKALGYDSPLLELQPAHRYADRDAALAAVAAVGERIRHEGLPDALAPVVIGLTGGGNVAAGATSVLEHLPIEEITPDGLADWVRGHAGTVDRLGLVRLDGGDLVEHVERPDFFEWQDYFDHPEHYRSRMAPWLRHLTLLVHGIYWDERYPRLVRREDLAALFDTGPAKLLAIGDITCDIEGSLACTVRETDPGDPVYVYDPRTGDAPMGFEGEGIAVLAVGNLPAELPIDASQTFSDALEPFVPQLARADLIGALDRAGLPDPLRRAVLVWNGQFTPDFAYMRAFLDGAD